MHHIFIEEKFINEKVIIIDRKLDEENFRHLKLSLRINLNEEVLVSPLNIEEDFDYLTFVKEIDKEYIILEIKEKLETNENKYHINLYQGMPKLDKLEFIIEKATELGVFSIIPINMANSIAKFDNEKKEKKLERLKKIAKSAAEQSKRHIIPEIKEALTFIEMIEKIKDDRFNILFYEDEKEFKTNEILKDIKNKIKENENINIIIGPEGGFSEKEIGLVKNNNINILSLGKNILRTETAGIVAISFINYELGN